VQLFLIRHPRPLIDDGICYGRLDVEAEDPSPVADRLRLLLPEVTPLISSPLRRARTLAEALHAQPVFDQRLMEIDLGTWEGQRWEQIERAQLDAWANDLLHFAPPGGESAAMLQARVVACIADLRRTTVALVTHAGPIRAALGYWLQIPVQEWSSLELAFGSITQLEIQGDAAPIVHYVNR